MSTFGEVFKSGNGAARPAFITEVSTATLLAGLALTSFALSVLTSNNAVGVFAPAAIGLGLSLSIATGIEALAGVRNLIRVDILALWVLYLLTFLEFLFPQAELLFPQTIDALVSPEAATSGTYAVFIGFAGLALGRHLVSRRESHPKNSAFMDVRPASIFLFFVLATLFGFLHIFLAVNFDPLEVLRQMALPRFEQSWGRGRYGDEYALLYELGQALIYLIPPVAGLIYARSREYNSVQKAIVTVVVLFTFYFGFASGTRNIFGSYVITFLGSYFLNKSELKVRHLLFQGLPILLIVFVGMIYMLEFRTEGLSRYSFEENGPATIYVDHNMVVISRVTEIFPDQHDYLGLEIPYFGLIHPIPRFFWPDKPESLSFSIEETFGLDPASVTLAATFVGEMYMSGGFLAVLTAGLLLGALAEFWNRLGRNVHSQFGLLLYVSGFVCAAVTMRSTMWMSVTALPTLALWIYGKLWLSRPNPVGSQPRSSAPI